jgi:hypothetical protein
VNRVQSKSFKSFKQFNLFKIGWSGAGLFALVLLLSGVARAAETKSDWQTEWEKTIRGAKREGRLSLYLYQGEGELGAVAQLFQKKYPKRRQYTYQFGRVHENRHSQGYGCRGGAAGRRREVSLGG